MSARIAWGANRLVVEIGLKSDRGLFQQGHRILITRVPLLEDRLAQ